MLFHVHTDFMFLEEFLLCTILNCFSNTNTRGGRFFPSYRSVRVSGAFGKFGTRGGNVTLPWLRLLVAEQKRVLAVIPLRRPGRIRCCPLGSGRDGRLDHTSAGQQWLLLRCSRGRGEEEGPIVSVLVEVGLQPAWLLSFSLVLGASVRSLRQFLSELLHFTGKLI